MSIVVGGTTIPITGDYVKVGSTNVDKVDVVRNNIRTTVWQKIKEKIVIPYGSHFNQSTPSINETYMLHKNALGGHANYGRYSCQVVSPSLQAVQIQDLTNYNYAYFEYMIKDIDVIGIQIRNHNSPCIGFGYCDPEQHPEKKFAIDCKVDFFREGDQEDVYASGAGIDEAISDGRIQTWEVKYLYDGGQTAYVSASVAYRLVFKSTVNISGLTGSHGIQAFLRNGASPDNQRGKILIGFCKLMS